ARNDRSVRLSWSRANSGGNAEQGDRVDGRIRLRFARFDRLFVFAGAAVFVFDFASACNGSGMPGCICAARFTGRRKARKEIVGEYEDVQARAEEARLSIQGERNADHSD